MFISDEVREIEKIMKEQLDNIAASKTKKDKEFFAGEYYRIKKIYDEKMQELIKFDIENYGI